MTDAAQRLWGVVEPYLAAEQVELDDVEIRGGAGQLVRIVVDADGGVDVDRIADLHRGIARLLSETDPALGDSALEVTSPGLERSLRLPKHYAKAVGREVKVKTKDDSGTSRNHRGMLVGSDDQTFTLDVDGDRQEIRYDSVVSATTVFEWKKSPKPGKAKRAPHSKAGSTSGGQEEQP